MIFLDTNIFMYAAGDQHSNKDNSVKILELVAMNEIQTAINVEVIQEVLHRYTHIGEKSEGIKLAEYISCLMDTIYSVEMIDMKEAIKILHKFDVTSRDAIHAASCKNRGIKKICTYDRHFHKIKFLSVIKPAEILKK